MRRVRNQDFPFVPGIDITSGIEALAGIPGADPALATDAPAEPDARLSLDTGTCTAIGRGDLTLSGERKLSPTEAWRKAAADVGRAVGGAAIGALAPGM